MDPVTVAVPGATAVTTPSGLTVTIRSSPLDHATATPGSTSPDWSRTSASSRRVSPTVNDRADGATTDIASEPGGSVGSSAQANAMAHASAGAIRVLMPKRFRSP